MNLSSTIIRSKIKKLNYIDNEGVESLTNTSWHDQRAVDKLNVLGQVNFLRFSQLDEEIKNIESLNVGPFGAVQFTEVQLVTKHLDVHASGDLVFWGLELQTSQT